MIKSSITLADFIYLPYMAIETMENNNTKRLMIHEYNKKINELRIEYPEYSEYLNEGKPLIEYMFFVKNINQDNVISLDKEKKKINRIPERVLYKKR